MKEMIMAILGNCADIRKWNAGNSNGISGMNKMMAITMIAEGVSITTITRP